MQQTAQVRPATPPPDFDLDLALTSLARMRDVGAQRLLFSHYGPVTAVHEVLQESEVELHYWVEAVRQARAQSPDIDHAVALVKERDQARHPGFYDDPDRVRTYEDLSSVQANVLGISRWLDQTQSPQ